MSARREWNGGAFITCRDAANAADFMTRTASSCEPAWKDPSQWRVVYPADIGEALSVVEDLWLRIARHPAVRSTVLTDASTQECIVMFRRTGNGKGNDRDSECCQLLAAASIQESYGWRQDGGHGSLVSDIQWAGDTLLIELTSAGRMQRWPEGEAVEWALQGLLQRVKQQEAMKVLRNWRMHAAKSAHPQSVGPRPASYVTEARETMGGRLVVDLPARFHLTLGFKPGVRIWFAPRADGFAITSKPCGPRGAKRHSRRILNVHMPLRLCLSHRKSVRCRRQQ